MNLDKFLHLEPLISNGMSTFQMKNFVVNDSITPYRKLRQALIETKSRLEVLTTGEFDLKENQLRLQQAQIDFASLAGIEQQLKELDIKRLEFTINRTSALRIQQTREVEFFLGIIEDLIVTVGGTEKAMEMLSDPQQLMDNESEYWTKRLARGVFSDFVNFGTITKGVIESISMLSTEQQQEIIQLALNQQMTLTNLVDSTRDKLLVTRD
jgi:hypothetical protein